MLEDTTLPKLVLDNEGEVDLLDKALQRAIAASDRTITDVSPGSVVYSLIQGSVFPVAELLYYLNMLPEALAIEVLRLSGVSRRPGTYATGTFECLLTRTLPTPFLIPAGTVIPWQDGGYRLVEPLAIPAGQSTGRADVEAIYTGSRWNADAYTVSIGNSGFTYAQNIYNVTDITGGTDLEDLDKCIERGQASLRSRDTLVSVTDYEATAEDLLGSGRAKAIPMLSADKQTEAIGQVHVFLVTESGTVPSPATCQAIQTEMQQRSFVASRTWVSPVDLYPCVAEVTTAVDQLSDGLAQDIYQAVLTYLSPMTFPIGGTVNLKRLEYHIQDVPGVTTLVSCQLAPEGDPLAPLNLPMPYMYSLPRLESMTVTLVDPTGLAQTYYLGTGQGDPD